MRTSRATLLILAVLVLVAPTPAQAWFAWLDNLSGPGKFRGPEFNFRLVCFGEESEYKRLVDGLKTANVLERKVVDNTGATDTTAVRNADAAWLELIAALRATRVTFPVDKGANLDELPTRVREKTRQYRENKARANRTAEASLDELNSEFAASIAPVGRGIAAISWTGVFLSACSTDTQRRSSVELDANFWYADGSKDFASGEEIRLTTLMPMFSFRVFTDPRFDFLDAGIGAGVYWLTSRGFESFSGVVLQPGRFDFHAPTLWSTYPWKGNHWRRMAAIPTFRFAVMTFPAGFAPNAFGVGDRHERIRAELIKQWSVFFNLAPFVRRAPFVTDVKNR